MENTPDRRTEKRLRYHWPVWFAEDFAGILTQGQMVDVCSGGAAFTCYSNDAHAYPGQHLTARFSVPCHHPEDGFNMSEFIRSGSVCRVDHLSSGLRRIAVKFFEPLPFKPGEQEESQFDYEQVADAVIG